MSITFAALDHQAAFADVVGLTLEEKGLYLEGLLAGVMGASPDRFPNQYAKMGCLRGQASRSRYEERGTRKPAKKVNPSSDPRWQKLRLKVMERDGFRCSLCECTDRTLHVHHLSYVPGGALWDSPMDQLTTLCEVCHGHEHGKAAQ